MTKLFFAYSAQPESTRETVANACKALDEHSGIEARAWESLQVGSRVVIAQIMEAIESCDLLCGDVTTLNANVLFELGYGLALQRPLQILLDTSDDEANQLFKQFGLLSEVGYLGYANSLEIRSRLLGSLGVGLTPLWADLVGTTLVAEVEHSIFYLPLNHITEASRTVSRRLQNADRAGWDVISADHSELSLAPLAWYVQHIYKTDASLFHFAAPRRSNARVHNARTAFLAGIAVGLGRDVLMIAEETFEAPFDYQRMLRAYESARQAGDIAGTWLTELETQHAAVQEPPVRVPKPTGATELQRLNFFEYVAEQEARSLSEYFVRTQQFEQLLSSPSTVFVGRKGVGKTANMLQAAEILREDRRILVCVIKPADYELRGLVSVLKAYQGVESLSYLTENMWKLLLYSEIARAAIEAAEARPAGLVTGSPESDLEAFLSERGVDIREDFAARLEQLARRLDEDLPSPSDGVAEARVRIGSILGGSLVRDLRRRLEPLLASYDRVAVLVDNLDKAWDKRADLDALASLLLGLLTAVGRVADEVGTPAKPGAMGLTLSVFLRSDVYNHMLRVAREPDKIRAVAIDWDNPELLRRVAEQRYEHTIAGRSGSSLWDKYFCSQMDGLAVKDWVTEHVLPRPRDLLFLLNAAVASAVNAGRDRITEADLARALREYSHFAFEAALVPNGITSQKLEELLYEFAGASAVVSRATIAACMQAAGLDAVKLDSVVEHLLSIEFLGREIGDGRFSFGAEGADAKVAEVVARRRAKDLGRESTFAIHPAFRSYLELV